MRISDWSSDVCSSDLERQFGEALAGEGQLLELVTAELAHAQALAADFRLFGQNARRQLVGAHFEAEECHRRTIVAFAAIVHSEGRSVGTECFSTCSSRWSLYH